MRPDLLPRPSPDEPRGQLKRRVMPGLWIDMANNIHWSIPEILEEMKMKDTPENRDFVMQVIREMMEAHTPGIRILESE